LGRRQPFAHPRLARRAHAGARRPRRRGRRLLRNRRVAHERREAFARHGGPRDGAGPPRERHPLGPRRGQRRRGSPGAPGRRPRRHPEPHRRPRRQLPPRQSRGRPDLAGGERAMRILIVEDSVLLREGLVRLLEDAGHEITAALPDASHALDAAAEQDPDLAIVDVRLPPTFTDEGIRAALSLRKQDPRLAVLVFSQYVEERYAADLIAQPGGAIGYLLKDRVTDVAEFLESLDRIHSGATVLDPEVVAQLLTRRSRDEQISRLTDRERSVLALIAE